MVLRHADESDFPALKHLWRTCFGDEDAYIDQFFSDLFQPCHSFVAQVDGEVRSMIFSIPSLLRTPFGELNCHYLYSLATAPACRGQGLGRQVLDFAHAELARQGVDMVALKPGDEGLFAYYANAGYETTFFCRELTAEKGNPISVEVVSPQRYGHLREPLLVHVPHLEHSPALLNHAAKCLTYFELRFHGAVCCAAAEADGDGWFVKELLTPPGLESQALAGLSCHLAQERLSARCPAGDGPARPFGMTFWCARRHKTCSPAYLGLALD